MLSRGERARTEGPGGAGEGYRNEIESVELPAAVAEHVAYYEAAVGDRDRFVWKWVAAQLDRFRLPTVANETATRETKLLLTVYVTTVDDTVERRGDRATFEYARELPCRVGEPTVPAGADEATVAFLTDLWGAIETRLRAAPRYEEFAELFEYDLRQVWNAIDYSRVFNATPSVATLDELRRYDAHNMVVFPYAGIDLAHSPSFDRSELGALRALLWELQVMARIGNWLSTWEREVTEGDYASGVVARAADRGIVDPADGTRESLRSTVAAHDVEADLLDEWDRTRTVAEARADRVTSFDAHRLVDGMSEILGQHLASHGLK